MVLMKMKIIEKTFMQTKQVLKASALALILSACGNSKDVVAPPVEQPVNLSNQLMMSTLWMQHAAECRVLQKQQYKTFLVDFFS